MAKIIFDVTDLNTPTGVNTFFDQHTNPALPSTWPELLIINPRFEKWIQTQFLSRYNLYPKKLTYRGIPCEVKR